MMPIVKNLIFKSIEVCRCYSSFSLMRKFRLIHVVNSGYFFSIFVHSLFSVGVWPPCYESRIPSIQQRGTILLQVCDVNVDKLCQIWVTSLYFLVYLVECY